MYLGGPLGDWYVLLAAFFKGPGDAQHIFPPTIDTHLRWLDANKETFSVHFPRVVMLMLGARPFRVSPRARTSLSLEATPLATNHKLYGSVREEVNC